MNLTLKKFCMLSPFKNTFVDEAFAMHLGHRISNMVFICSYTDSFPINKNICKKIMIWFNKTMIHFTIGITAIPTLVPNIMYL